MSDIKYEIIEKIGVLPPYAALPNCEKPHACRNETLGLLARQPIERGKFQKAHLPWRAVPGTCDWKLCC
jgi:hypothetical protein